MKINRILLGLTVLGLVVGAAVLAKKAETASDRMTDAADKFLAALSPEQKTKATFGFDDKERTNWNFVPLQTKERKYSRKGLPLEEMTAEQRKAALDLLRAGTSASGYVQATTIMSLENILKDLEKNGAMVRNPDWYFFTVFGTPSRTGKWGWRVEGHHLSLNFTFDKGKITGATPAFFGANPATVKDGPKKGTQVLEGSEKLARELYQSLDAEQKKGATQEKQFAEIEQAKTKPNVGAPVGLPATKMTADQKAILKKLVVDYAQRLPEEISTVELNRVKEAGFDNIRFAVAGEIDKAGKPYTYRVQGPTFVIEFLNVQADSGGNPANHIHSSWRNLEGDFGLASN